MVEPQDITVEMALVGYLASLDGAKRQSHEAAVQNFARWYGRHRSVGAIRPRDVDGYCQTVVTGQAAALRGFFSYAYKKRLTPRGLSSHVKVRKDPNTAPRNATGTPSRSAQVTREGIESLKTELEDLLAQRVVVTDQMRTAAADKDFRENAPLQAAREQKSILEGKILEIEQTLSNATIVDENGVRDSIGIGDTVKLTDVAKGTVLTYKLVDTRESSPANGRLSASSPIGKSIIGKVSGDECEFVAPAGTFKYVVERCDHNGSK
ncbi:MAG: GreA/GreB family elongation factor [Dehalococcoidia bacterium]|nr:GreA/GreB family elongation factor [Dehalococcoidia bacterium]